MGMENFIRHHPNKVDSQNLAGKDSKLSYQHPLEYDYPLELVHNPKLEGQEHQMHPGHA